MTHLNGARHPVVVKFLPIINIVTVHLDRLYLMGNRQKKDPPHDLLKTYSDDEKWGESNGYENVCHGRWDEGSRRDGLPN